MGSFIYFLTKVAPIKILSFWGVCVTSKIENRGSNPGIYVK